MEAARQKLTIFCQQPQTIGDMMSLLGWHDRTKFRKKFIYPLIANGQLTMTIPDKPQSSNQRYITVK